MADRPLMDWNRLGLFLKARDYLECLSDECIEIVADHGPAAIPSGNHECAMLIRSDVWIAFADPEII